MGLLGRIDPKSEVNVWLLVVLSLIPIACIYSFSRIKKFRKMFMVNLVIIGIFLLFVASQHYQISSILQSTNWLNYIIIPGIDAFFVWKWAREYNSKIKIENI